VTDYFNEGACLIPRVPAIYDLSANFDLGSGWGINGHVGHLVCQGLPLRIYGRLDKIDYTDWKIGVTKDISGWVIGRPTLIPMPRVAVRQPSFTASPTL
jgi:hypothetical protein